MTKLDALFLSQRMDWGTPQDLFDSLNKEFVFTLDPCALPYNAKCKTFFTPEDDGLSKSWEGHTVFCNPPYGRQIQDWVRKCKEESRKPNTTVVMLIPARTDTAYFHDYIYKKVKEIRFIKGRLKFTTPRCCSKASSAPFPSMIIVF